MRKWLLHMALGMALAPGINAAAQAATKQEIYNQAQAAFDAENWGAAIKGFEQVLGAPAAKQNHSQAIIRGRLAQAYLKAGRLHEAQFTARSSLDGLEPTDVVDLGSTWLTLGEALRFDLDMANAIAAYKKVIALAPADSPLIVEAQIGLAGAAMVTNPAQAAAALDTVLNNKTFLEAAGKGKTALLEDLRGRAELNLGNVQAAVGYFERAVQHSGGISGNKVSIRQVVIRGDAAIGYQLLHDDERTRKYLAYTGAGHTDWNGWASADSLELPICGEDNDLRPEDTAVIEFVLGEDGHVAGAAPVYANRIGNAGIEFARAVRRWYWAPEKVAKFDVFWRASMRIQVRCLSRPAPEQLSDSFWQATRSWLLAHGATDNGGKLNIPNAGGRLNEASLAAIMGTVAMPARKGGVASGDQADQILGGMDAPADVHAYVLYRRLPAKGNSWTEQARSRVEGLKDRVPAFEARWPGSRAAAWLRLEYAMALENSGAFDSAKPELEKVLATAQDQVGAADPIRIIATVHLSTLKSHEGDNAAARRMLAESGLNAQQCSLFDIRPVATNSSVSSNDFPQEALLWRFEGYVREDYDIAANGQPTNIRTVIAYPPFVFERGTERILNKFRYLPPVVDGMAVGCLGKTLNINYTIPK